MAFSDDTDPVRCRGAGVYVLTGEQPVFRRVPSPTTAQLQALVQQIAERTGELLETRGPVERHMENVWLITDGPGGPLDDLIVHPITYRIAVGPRAGQKLFTLQALAASAMPEAEQQGDHRGAALAGGFSLHSGIDIEPGQRQKLERLRRYASRSPVAVNRMALTLSGQVRYTLKTPYRSACAADPPLVCLLPSQLLGTARRHRVPYLH